MVTSRDRIATPGIPFVFLYGVTGFTITTTPSPMNWLEAHIQTNDFGHKDNTSRIRINKSRGSTYYELYAQCGAVKATGNPAYLVVTLYINGVSEPCCTTHSSISAGDNHGDSTLIATFFASAEDYIEIYVNVNDGTATIEENTARLIIKGLLMDGWNNRAGGKDLRRGNYYGK